MLGCMSKRTTVAVALSLGVLLIICVIQYGPRATIWVYNEFLGNNPPWWIQRVQQRREVYTRVRSAGGWEALSSDCLRLLQTNQDGFVWFRGQTNQTVLPPAIAALQPKSVGTYSTNMLGISIFGTGSTHGRGVAEYALEVQLSSPAGTAPEHHYSKRTYSRIANDIYEAY